MLMEEDKLSDIRKLKGSFPKKKKKVKKTRLILGFCIEARLYISAHSYRLMRVEEFSQDL